MTSQLPPIQELLLRLVGEHRFASTHQLTRLTVHEYGNRRSAIRQTLRHLRHLKQHHFVAKLERRVGGWQGGSQISVWTLTTKGQRHITGNRSRVRPHHYSTTFLEHSLAVTETRVALHEATTQLDFTLEVQAEPACWRRHLDAHGKPVTLKPDLMATVISDAYVDRYFFEVDRATENPARVIRKCWQYLHYQRMGAEQQKHGVYPAVVWLVPNDGRKEQLERAIAAEPHLPGHLFIVLTLDALLPLIRDGPPGSTNP